VFEVCLRESHLGLLGAVCRQQRQRLNVANLREGLPSELTLRHVPGHPLSSCIATQSCMPGSNAKQFHSGRTKIVEDDDSLSPRATVLQLKHLVNKCPSKLVLY